MRAVSVAPRKNWQERCEKVGFTFYQTLGEDGVIRPYWDESRAYEFTPEEIEKLERATKELWLMCLQVGEHIIKSNLFERLAIPSNAVHSIITSWEREPPSIYGRFDLVKSVDDGEFKLLEFNADTPTCLVEAAVAQWYWLKDTMRGKTQFNLIHEALVEKWKDVKPHLFGPLYFGHGENTDTEDFMTIQYLIETAQQAGIDARGVRLIDIGWDGGKFVDLENQPIRSIFKLHPWEYILEEAFSEHILANYGFMQWIEPIWKMMLSNKGILPLLWQLYPDHPSLVPAYFDDGSIHSGFVRKPLLGREGNNITIALGDGQFTEEKGGPYGAEGYIRQEFVYTDLPHATVGSWIVDGEPVGVGVREANEGELIISNRSRFVPHYIGRPA